MPLYRASLQSLGAIALLAVALACGGKKAEPAAAASTTITIKGTVTYTRVPLAKDASGVPMGLTDASVATNLETKPARGAMVRIYQRTEQVNPDGSPATPIWLLIKSGFTDATGAYAMLVSKDKPLMVELMSTFDGGGGQPVNVIGDPGGINSAIPQASRYRYVMRKGVDGSAPAGNPTPAAVPAGDSTVDFSVGLTDTWWLVNPTYDRGSLVATGATSAIQETTLAGRTQGTGSRILAIGDAVAAFMGVYGAATPGATLDLHYAPGISEPRGSFVEYDPSVYPLAYDDYLVGRHYFGSIQAGPTNDDAWDDGVILPILARNVLYAGNRDRTFSIPLSPLYPPAVALTDLSPDLARIEGLAASMAAALLKSPYLADTRGTTLAAPVLDIRDISSLAPGQLSPCSAPAIRALGWEVVLKANGITSPGLLADWSNMNPSATARFFLAPALTLSASNRDKEPLNIYSQLARLKEAKATAEPVDLAAIFTDSVLTPLTAPFGVEWLRPTTGVWASFVADWGQDPNALTTPLSPFTLSMSKSVQVHGAFPNISQGEVFYGGFTLSADKRYVISVSISPALDTGSELSLDLPMANQSHLFSGSGGASPAITLPAVSYAAVPTYHAVRVRLKNSLAVQPDVTVTLAFTPSL